MSAPKLTLVRPASDDPQEVQTATPPLELLAQQERERARQTDLDEAREILGANRFWTEYQSIVNVQSGRTAGFEALARFETREGRLVSPEAFFALLQADPRLLLRAELTLKSHQLEHAPRAPLFVNLDPDSWCRVDYRHQNPFLGLFVSSPVRLIVEITENMAAANAVRVHEMIGALRARQLSVALDDIGSANGLFAFDAIADVEVLKFDRSLLSKLRHPRWLALVQALIRMAHETGTHTVLEGVETSDEFALARDLGFDLAQGFLFKDRTRIAKRA